jgi:hypothetical protein
MALCTDPERYRNHELGSAPDCHTCAMAQAPTEHCDGCDEDRTDVSPYLVTHHDGTTSDAAYCHDCAALARCDWNGETAAIVPATVRSKTDNTAT